LELLVAWSTVVIGTTCSQLDTAMSTSHDDPETPPVSEIQRSVLVAGLDDLSVPHHLSGAIGSAARCTHKHLTILFVSKLFGNPHLTAEAESDKGYISHTRTWNEIQNLLTFTYVQATKVAQELGRVLLEIDVLLKGVDETLPDDFADNVDCLYHVYHGKSKHVLFRLYFDVLVRRHTFATTTSTAIHQTGDCYICRKGTFLQRSDTTTTTPWCTSAISCRYSRRYVRPSPCRTQDPLKYGRLDRKSKGYRRRHRWTLLHPTTPVPN
jgi:hypothetical protein